jgi:hypothetical protein
VDGQTERDRQTDMADMAELIVTFRNFPYTPN